MEKERNKKNEKERYLQYLQWSAQEFDLAEVTRIEPLGWLPQTQAPSLKKIKFRQFRNLTSQQPRKMKRTNCGSKL